MRIHHLSCGAMQPYGGAGFDGQTPGLAPAELSCHCLLLERESGLVLVDTGAVSTDAHDATRRHPAFFLAIDRIRLNPAEAAANQIRSLGFAPADVGDIVMTHLDFDHAAGLIDFPGARIHLSADEAQAAMNPSGPVNRTRYARAQFLGSTPRWRTYANFEDDWFGLPSTSVAEWPDVKLISLPGHTPGHCGVAIQDGDGWLLHAADAIFHHHEIDPVRPSTPTLARAYQWFMQSSQRQRRQSLQALQRLARTHGSSVRIICTHDPSLLSAYR